MAAFEIPEFVVNPSLVTLPVTGLPIDTAGTLASNSDALIPTQKAVKTYADTKIASTAIDTDVALAANSDVRLASQKATLALATTKVPKAATAITGALSTVVDAPAKAVLTSIIAVMVAGGLGTDGTT